MFPEPFRHTCRGLARRTSVRAAANAYGYNGHSVVVSARRRRDVAETSAFSHWFSTKPWCDDTILLEYQFRKYTPEIGRWMSRDPIVSANYSLYAFCINNSPALHDCVGLFYNKFGNLNFVTVCVGKCEVVVLDGHGHSETPHSFVFPKEPCAGGCFIDCYPGVTNKRIPKHNIVPNAPVDFDCHDDIKYGDNWKNRKTVFKGAKIVANKFCESGCCKKVSIIFTSIIPPPGIFDIFSEALRKDTKYVFDCDSRKMSRGPGGQSGYPLGKESENGL